MSKFKEYLEATKVDKETNENDLLTKYLVFLFKIFYYS